jgi:hypothetical protein
MFRMAALTIALLVLACSDAVAEDAVGRYQAIIVPRPGEGPRLMFLDTRDGHLWTWWHLDIASGDTGITYLGKLVPGTQPGDVVQHFPAALP